MTLLSIILLLFFAMLSSFVQRTTGFGFGVVMMTMLPHIMPDYGEATGLSGIMTCTMALVPALRLRAYVRLKKLLPILITCLIVSFFAVKVLTVVDGASLKKVFGWVLLAVSLYLFFVSEKVRLRPTLPAQLSMGFLSGVLGGMFAMQGPPAALYFMVSSEGSKEEYIALTQWYFVIGNIAMTLYRADSGFITPMVGSCWLISLPAILLGLWVGSKVSRRMNIATLKKVVYAFLAAAGLLAILL